MNQTKKTTILLNLILVLLLFLTSCATTSEISDGSVSSNEDNVSSNEDSVSSNEDSVIEARSNAEKAKEEAINEKALYASPEEFNSGEKNYQLALEEQEKGNFKVAVESYMNATKDYINSKNRAIKERETALEAIARAKAAIEKTEENANQAIAEGMEEDI